MKDMFNWFKEWSKIVLGGTIWFIFTYIVIAIANLLCIGALIALLIFGLHVFGII